MNVVNINGEECKAIYVIIYDDGRQRVINL